MRYLHCGRKSNARSDPITVTHPKLRIAKSRATPDSRWMEDLLAWLRQGNPGAEQVRQQLAARVPEYTPQVRSIEQNEGTRPLVLP